MTRDEIIAGLEAADGREATVNAFAVVGEYLGNSAPEDFDHYVKQAFRSRFNTRAMRYLLLAAMTLVPEGWRYHISGGKDDVGSNADVTRVDEAVVAEMHHSGTKGHATDATALTIAALKARAAMSESEAA